jgi:hypothetical protein
MTRTSPTTYVQLRGYHKRETDKAILFDIREIEGEPLDKPKQEWFPVSQMKSQTYKKDRTMADIDELDELWVSQWIAQQKGFDV